MVLANGFISQTKFDVIEELRKRIKGKDIQPIPLPYAVETMTYYISDIGEVFGSQKYKDFYVTKPLKIENRYKAGCNIRVACGDKKYKNEWLHNLMYWTYVAKGCVEDIQIGFKDNNQYNYQLDNLHICLPKFPQVLHDNMEKLKDVYKSHFLTVAWYARFVSVDISLDDAKDIACNVFYEICKHDYAYSPDYFVGLWKSQVKKRVFEFMDYHNRFCDVVFDDGEERLHSKDKAIEILDITKHLSGNKTRKTIELWLQNETPTDIAKLMNCSLSTVSSCITRNIQKLKQIYKKDIEYEFG